jgi:hypothetical protein
LNEFTITSVVNFLRIFCRDKKKMTTRTPVQELEQIRQSGQLRDTQVTPVTDGVLTDNLQEVQLTAQTTQGDTYQTLALVNTQTNEMYDLNDLPMDVMEMLIESGQLVGVGVTRQMRSYCRYENGQPQCRRYQETVVSGMGPNGEVYHSRSTE